MVDLHSHFLPYIDDGAESLEETIEMLKAASRDGITHMIATPHYDRDLYQYEIEDVHKRFQEVIDVAKRENIAMELYLGNELMIKADLDKALSNKHCLSLAGSQYVLVEFPRLVYYENYLNMLYNINVKGYDIIIAHPERYEYVGSNINIVYDLVKHGYLMQIDAGSIIGKWGSDIKKTTIQLLRHNLVHFVGSDAHGHKKRRPELKAAYDEILKIIGKEKADELFIHNGLDVIKNKPINPEDPIRVKKKHWLFGRHR
ncbi:protein-tyrosine phosphatase [Natranaerovirga pectinivora]|uniref:protein-tyrosine-phosphatase n=1 Tax=Natranaerovirga pectinivora TaxID=682400 RepID=A0A4V2UZV5_9FIRM|nr:CpsB/CapC family capsule biosynthesis tyrosine phosphatase [Natranaerovirga pectinivora]TCT12832.1 protein-tyrosine phosphatase [Natranaerovirga pectinivora]